MNPFLSSEANKRALHFISFTFQVSNYHEHIHLQIKSYLNKGHRGAWFIPKERGVKLFSRVWWTQNMYELRLFRLRHRFFIDIFIPVSSKKIIHISKYEKASYHTSKLSFYDSNWAVFSKHQVYIVFTSNLKKYMKRTFVAAHSTESTFIQSK